MKTIRLLVILAALLVPVGAWAGTDWTTTEDGSAVCTSLRENGICWLTDIGADSNAINVRSCAKVGIMVYGTAVQVMPQSCVDRACAATADREDLLAAVLTGDSPNTFVTISTMLFDLLRIDWTSGTPTISIKCGR